eukprot:9472491-Pyramimonas_sp.AAC.2
MTIREIVSIHVGQAGVQVSTDDVQSLRLLCIASSICYFPIAEIVGCPHPSWSRGPTDSWVPAGPIPVADSKVDAPVRVLKVEDDRFCSDR